MRSAAAIRTIHKLETATRKEVLDKLRALPPNPKMKMLGSNCGVIRSKDSLGNWSAEFHLFDSQYEAVIKHLEKSQTLRVFMAKLARVLRTGRIPIDSQRSIALNPQVKRNIRKAIYGRV